MSNSTNSTADAPFPGFVPSTIILSPMAQFYVDNAPLQIAPWIMGTFADFFLSGILSAQIANYFLYSDFSGTQRRFTWLVITLTLMCALKSVQDVVIVWQTVIDNFANPDMSMMLVGIYWWHYTTSLSTAIIATFVQGFFAYRYWMLTKRWWASAFMALAMVISLIGSAFVIVYISKIDHVQVKKWSLIHFVAAIIVDVSITIGTAWHLQSQKSNIQSTSDMIDRLVRMTWQSALPPTICVIVNAAVLEARPLELTHIAFNMVLPKLYAISLMYTLNVRNKLRAERMTSHERSTGTNPNLQIGKRSFVPNDLAYRSGGGVAVVSGGGGGTQGQIERGVSFMGRGRGYSGGNSNTRRVEGIHVETHITTHGGSSGGGVELDTFNGDIVKPMKGSPYENDDWESDKKYHAQ